MPRRSLRSSGAGSKTIGRNDADSDDNDSRNNNQEDQQPRPNNRRLPEHVRDRQRAVAEREASRLARPERRPTKSLGHADRKKSAVSSTPFGVHVRKPQQDDDSEVEEWCGPFSVARQMIAKREEARRKRVEEQEGGENKEHHPLDEAMEELEQEKKRKAHPSLQWKGSSSTAGYTAESLYAKRQKRVELLGNETVPSLFQICVNFLIENFEYVESLGHVDSSVRSVIATELVAKKKMNSDAFQSLVEPGMEALEVVDCAEVTQEQLAKSLKALLPAGLRYLSLGQAGRCFGPAAVRAMLSCGDSKLFALSIGGAYLLKDEDAASLIRWSSATLSSIEFKACPLLGKAFCKSISESFSPSKEENGATLVEFSLEDLDLGDPYPELLSSKDFLRQLRSLSLRRVGGTKDEVVVEILEAVGSSLEHLDLSFNYDLTDVCLSGIRKFNPSLRSLHLAHLKNLSSAGLETFFTLDLPGLPPPPALKTITLANCDYEAVTDEVMELLTRVASRKPEGLGAAASFSSLGGLMHVNIQGSSLVTDTTMEHLAAACGTSLKELNVSFCPQISDKGLGYLVEQASDQLTKIHVWGCAQFTDEFFDGHNRAEDRNFEVVGAWMKKSGTRSLR